MESLSAGLLSLLCLTQGRFVRRHAPHLHHFLLCDIIQIMCCCVIFKQTGVYVCVFRKNDKYIVWYSKLLYKIIVLFFKCPCCGSCIQGLRNWITPH